MDPYSSQRQQALRVLEALQVAQDDIVRLQEASDAPLVSAASTRSLAYLQQNVSIIQEMQGSFKMTMVTDLQELQNSWTEGLKKLAHKISMKQKDLELATLKLSRLQEKERDLTNRNKKLEREVSQAGDYRVVQAEGRRHSVELDAAKLRLDFLEAENLRVGADNQDLRAQVKAVLGDIALLRGVRERLDVSEQRLRSAEEELGLQRDKFAADIRAASSDFEARLGTQKATTDLTIAQLVKERDELLAMGVGSRFGQFVELKAENVRLHLSLDELGAANSLSRGLPAVKAARGLSKSRGAGATIHGRLSSISDDDFLEAQSAAHKPTVKRLSLNGATDIPSLKNSSVAPPFTAIEALEVVSLRRMSSIRGRAVVAPRLPSTAPTSSGTILGLLVVPRMTDEEEEESPPSNNRVVSEGQKTLLVSNLMRQKS